MGCEAIAEMIKNGVGLCVLRCGGSDRKGSWWYVPVLYKTNQGAGLLVLRCRGFVHEKRRIAWNLIHIFDKRDPKEDEGIKLRNR